MKKLFNWIWSKEEVKPVVIHKHQMVDVGIREYNLIHGLPEDQVIGR